MKVVADLQLHSKYARAVSPQMIPTVISEWAKKKGIGLIATGDWTHPLWFRELEANLVEAGEGVYKLNSKFKIQNSKLEQDPLFILSTEVSSIYKQGEKVRKVHTLIFAPSFEAVRKINKELTLRGANLMSDGRPIVGLSAKAVAEIALTIDKQCLIVPAHAWTPFFALFGSMSGFDSIEECFGDLSPYIYAIETGLSCYDEKTEVLTQNGWKKFSEVDLTDGLCTLNIESGVIEYQVPRRIFQYNYKGKMYKLKTKRIDLLVTPNHNLLFSPCDFRKPAEFYLKTAEKMFGKSKRFKKDGIWKGENMQHFILPACKIRHGSRFYSGFRDKQKKHIPIKAWLKFFGLWIAEGWTSKWRGDYGVYIANKDSKLLSEIKTYLKSFEYKVYQDEKIIRVRDYQLFSYLRQFGKASDKFIPLEIKSLPKQLLEIFFEYYIKGDGHVYGGTGKGLSATTISIRLRDDLQEIALKIGISAYYKLGYKKGTQFHGALYKDRIYRQSADSWVVYFIRKNLHTTLPSTIRKHNYIEEWVDFEGRVSCASVANKVVYIRRNGIPVWCGNSDPAMNWRIEELDTRQIVSFSDAHSPQKLGREATVFELSEVTYENLRKAIIGDSRQKINHTIEFYPEEGKYHFTGHRNCKVVYSPNEARKMGTICPVCGRPLTVGVMSRVEELAKGGQVETRSEIDQFGVRWIRPSLRQAQDRRPYVMMVPLIEIIAESLGMGTASQKVMSTYELMVQRLGSEFKILLETEREKIDLLVGEKIGEAISKVRSSDIFIEPGYDGLFGRVKIWKEEETKKDLSSQATLF